jgi:5'-methylthioadenosine phosphorylase
LKSSEKPEVAVIDGTELETPAEIEMFRDLGGDLIGMTGASEAILPRELEICYATVCFVANMVSGIQKQSVAKEASETPKKSVAHG